MTDPRQSQQMVGLPMVKTDSFGECAMLRKGGNRISGWQG